VKDFCLCTVMLSHMQLDPIVMAPAWWRMIAC
jgi:hypothetical protein